MSTVINHSTRDWITHHITCTSSVLSSLIGIGIFALGTRAAVDVVGPRREEVATGSEIARLAGRFRIATGLARQRVDDDLPILPLGRRVSVPVRPAIGGALDTIVLDETVSNGPRGRVARVLVVSHVLDPKVVEMTGDIAADGAYDVDEEIQADAEADEHGERWEQPTADHDDTVEGMVPLDGAFVSGRRHDCCDLTVAVLRTEA